MGVPTTNGGIASPSQWLFSVSALHSTPSGLTSGISLDRELYDRARGVEFLFRLGVSLALPSSAMYTAATWFHRFYMRYPMDDYHRQAVAASCIFLATKTEECPRKLRDVAKIYCSKVSSVDVKDIPEDSREVEESQTLILLTEEALLEALCFDFVVDNPQSELIDLFDAKRTSQEVEDYAWSIANDSSAPSVLSSYLQPLTSSLDQVSNATHVVDGPTSTSLSVRIASPAPSASLPTPPSQKAISPEETRFAIEYFGFNEVELSSVGDALAILLEFYATCDIQGNYQYLAVVTGIAPPTTSVPREPLYKMQAQNSQATSSAPLSPSQGRNSGEAQPTTETPAQTKTPTRGWKPVKGDVSLPEKPPGS
ncbi:hypothetical protein NLI96_g8001 [Meripilus lineatus]|uniref:Cyclin-like domain-containing protein n=1 Tax=Meripilus lineatus TaxID=2056292 RepID=A0AAD5V2U4_9APHY|nr:hypothetical protein NLI96_g8001 [Physisporinus lineatus]